MKKYKSILADVKKEWRSGAASKVLRGMLILLYGNAVARAVGILIIPVLTRIYQPGDFGVLVILNSLITMLAPVMTLRYVLAIPLPRRDEMAANILALSVLAMTVLSFAMFVVLGLYHKEIFTLLSLELLLPYWWVVVVGLVTSGAYEIFSTWAIRKKNYRSVSVSVGLQSIYGAAIKVGLGLIGMKPAGLLIGQVASYGAGTLKLMRAHWSDLFPLVRFVTRRRLILVIAKYKNFPIYRLPSQFLLAFSSSSLAIFCAVLYGEEVTGQLGLALMAIAVPIGLVGNSISNAFYAEVSAIGARKSEEIRLVTHNVIFKLAIFACPPSFFLFFFGEELFGLFFGDEWVQAGDFASLLSLYLVSQFIQVPVSRLLFIYDGHKLLLWLSTQRALIVVFCFGLAYLFEYSAESFVLIYSLMLAVHYFISVLATLAFIPSGKKDGVVERKVKRR